MSDSGYAYCACRDCGDIVVNGGSYCQDCEGHCGPDYSTSDECQSPTAHTYCPGDSAYSEEVWQAAHDDAPIERGKGAWARAQAYARKHDIKGLRQYCGVCGQEF